MSLSGADAILHHESLSYPIAIANYDSDRSLVGNDQVLGSSAGPRQRHSGQRRTPRKSLIVVLPENHVVSADLVADRLSRGEGEEEINVILACAGQPSSIAALRRRVADLQVLLAPAGTSGEDLRELAMSQAPGDIVTLLTGIPA